MTTPRPVSPVPILAALLVLALLAVLWLAVPASPRVRFYRATQDLAAPLCGAVRADGGFCRNRSRSGRCHLHRTPAVIPARQDHL